MLRATSTSRSIASRKPTVAAALAALPEDQGNPDEAIGHRLVGFLNDLASAWQVATPAERNTDCAAALRRGDRGKSNGRGGGATAGDASFLRDPELSSSRRNDAVAEATGVGSVSHCFTRSFSNPVPGSTLKPRAPSAVAITA